MRPAVLARRRMLEEDVKLRAGSAWGVASVRRAAVRGSQARATSRTAAVTKGEKLRSAWSRDAPCACIRNAECGRARASQATTFVCQARLPASRKECPAERTACVGDADVGTAVSMDARELARGQKSRGEGREATRLFNVHPAPMTRIARSGRAGYRLRLKISNSSDGTVPWGSCANAGDWSAADLVSVWAQKK
ncbi:hypothetical protein FB451DRAFT_1175384 [Mycena latifolia]|nr:hypothetical protein FB451DRAFT_1175384 [Mycena latifolia]